MCFNINTINLSLDEPRLIAQSRNISDYENKSEKDYDDLDNYDGNYGFVDDDEYRKIRSIRTLFKEFDRDYCKPIITDNVFAGGRNNYIEYKSKGERYESLSPKKYLKMIRPYLRDLINDNKATGN